MKNTHMYIWKIATIILSFVMIVGLWSGIKLDAKAEETQKITEVELIVRAPKAGEDLATVENGGVSVSTPGVKVTDVKWCKGESYSSYLKEEKGLAEYSTRYAVWVQLEAEGNAVFDLTKRPTINGKDIGYGLNDNILTITYGSFPRTETDPGKIIYSVDITVDQPVVGQNLVYTCRLSTSGVRWSGVKWLYTDNRGYVYGPAKYNTEYKVQVELVPETDYKFAPINKIKATINGQADTELLEGTYGNIFVKYTFPAISPEPSSGDYKIIEGNDSNYVPGSNKPLSFRGDGDYDKFSRVDVDRSPVTRTDYTVSSGSTIITFKPNYLATLSNGTHTIEMFWNINGAEKSATASFHIGEKSGEVVPGNTGTTQPADNTESKPGHVCSFEWVITLDPTTGADGLEEYKCTGCGVVQESHPIPASVAVIKDFYGKVKEAPEKGSITYDAGKLHTISDYILKKMAERNDVSVTVKFEYQNKKYQIIFPAGLDYSAVLNDEETMYGYFGAAAKLGLKVTGQ